MKTRTIAALGAALALTCTQHANAQANRQALRGAANSVAAFDASKERCNFDSAIHRKFAEADAYFGAKSQYWEQMKAEASDGIASTQNTVRMMEPKRNSEESYCKSVSILVSSMAPMLMSTPLFDPDFHQKLIVLLDKPASPKASAKADVPRANEGGNFFKLNKPLVESAFACLRTNLNLDPEPKFFPNCIIKVSKEFDTSPAQNFRLAYLVYTEVYKWSVAMKVPIKMPDPDEEGRRCEKDKTPINCISLTNWLAFSALIKIITDYKNPDALESLRSALVENGG